MGGGGVSGQAGAPLTTGRGRRLRPLAMASSRVWRVSIMSAWCARLTLDMGKWRAARTTRRTL